MEQPLVSIIIPTYNSIAYLKEAVTSALSQSYEFIEIIVIDDGSTDQTRDLFPEFETHGVLCFYIDNGGASNARNYGLEKASGDYIQFLDADDIIAPTKIEKQLSLMRKQQVECCYSPWINFKEYPNDGHQTEFRFSHIDHSLIRTGKELMISYGMENWFIPTVAWLISKTVIKKAGYWNPAKCPNDDGEFFSRILFWTDKVICCNEIFSYYRLVDGDSLSKLNSTIKIDSSFRSHKQIEALLTTCSDKRLMCYPKRHHYMSYRLIKKKYPKLAKRAARNFDAIKSDSFLRKKKQYWRLINWFGIYNGTKIYKLLMPIWNVLKK
jgi:glycosyltransferase involved in cell wall biosynthesis